LVELRLLFRIEGVSRMKAAIGIVVVSGVLAFSPAAFGEEPKAAAPPAGSAGKTAPAMIVVADPDTGQLRAATAAEIEALKAASPATPAAKAAVSGKTTVVERFASGRVRAKLGPEFMRYSVVRVNPDGTLASDCVPEAKVDAAMKASAPAAKIAAEEK
jgi:hypothetical protein